MKRDAGGLQGLLRSGAITLLILLGVPMLMGLMLAVYLWFHPTVF